MSRLKYVDDPVRVFAQRRAGLETILPGKHRRARRRDASELLLVDLPPHEFFDWLRSHRELTPEVRENYVAWYFRGRPVVRFQMRSTDKQFLSFGTRGTSRELGSTTLTQLVGEVERLIDERRSADRPDEAWLQSTVMRCKNELGLRHVTREVALSRSGRRASGRADLVGTDQDNVTHIVEVKLAGTDGEVDRLALFQGFDYVSAESERLRAWVNKLEAPPMVLDIVIGAHPGHKCRLELDPFLRALASRCRASVSVRFWLVDKWWTQTPVWARFIV